MNEIDLTIKFKKNGRLKFEGPTKLLKDLKITKKNEKETFFILSSMATIEESYLGTFFLNINTDRFSKKKIIKKVSKNRKEHK